MRVAELVDWATTAADVVSLIRFTFTPKYTGTVDVAAANSLVGFLIEGRVSLTKVASWSLRRFSNSEQ